MHLTFRDLFLFLPLVALLEIAEATGVIEMAHIGSQPDDTADGLDRKHQGTLCKFHAAGFSFKQREKELLLGDVPTTIAGRETIGVMPA
jgi:hypothetical protein